MHIVIEHPDLPGKPRALSSPEALAAHEARGWVALGETTQPHLEPLRTDVEYAADQAAEQAHIAALSAPKSDVAPASSRPSK